MLIACSKRSAKDSISFVPVGSVAAVSRSWRTPTETTDATSCVVQASPSYVHRQSQDAVRNCDTPAIKVARIDAPARDNPEGARGRRYVCERCLPL